MSLDPQRLTAQAAALKAAGQFDEAIALCREVVSLAPRSGGAEHNLAAALGDAGRWREAERHVRAAFSKGSDLPETWLLLARTLQALSQFDEAERAFREALRRRSDLFAAHSELAQLVWMRTGDRTEALRDVEAALAKGHASLVVIKAQVLEHAGRLEEAYGLLSQWAHDRPSDVTIVGTASQLALALGEDDAALTFAERAHALAPDSVAILVTLISAHLAAEKIERANALIARLRHLAPNDQHALALQAIVWRVLGDPRYRALYDYDAFVAVSMIDAPAGWADLTAYLADVAAGLEALHDYKTHPLHQSIRQGTQTADLLNSDNPAIAALPQALGGAIERYIAKLGAGGDPMRGRSQGGYAYQSMWSIRMSAGGFHIDHVHPRGWISSACYIKVPENLSGKEGWLKFGEPGVRTAPKLAAEHFIEPAPGKLVLFPSYMWHGTQPFTDTSVRMTVAFDLAPAPAR